MPEQICEMGCIKNLNIKAKYINLAITTIRATDKNLNKRLRSMLITCSRPPPWSFFTIMKIIKCFCTTCEALYTTVRMAPQAAGFCRSGRIDFLLAQKHELLQSNSRPLGCERVMETWAEFHFSWIYTFSATLSSLRNWENNDRYWLRPSTPVQLCWLSSRL